MDYHRKKYIGAVVRKSFQLAIAAEQDHFENKSPVPNKTQLFLRTGPLNKNKTILNIVEFREITLILSPSPKALAPTPSG